MQLLAHSMITRERNSTVAGTSLAQSVLDKLGPNQPALALLYSTVEHDQKELVRAAKAVLGATPLVGCSTSGMTGKGTFFEGSYGAGILGLGGPAIQAATGLVQDYHQDSRAKARDLGRQLRGKLRQPAKAVVLLADPLCGADLETFAQVLQEELGCPVIGGGAGQPWGPIVQTYQYFDARLLSHATVAFAVGGDLTVEIATSTGTEPTPISAVVTRAEGNILLELDHQPALAVYGSFLGLGELNDLTNESSSAVALGVEMPGLDGESEALSRYVVRGPFSLDRARGGLCLGASIPEGTKIVFHRRSIQTALSGAQQCAQALARRLSGHTLRAVLGFECGARTAPLLGRHDTLREQILVQTTVGAHAEWLGMLAWGEIAPFAGRATYYNFTYPMLALAE